MLGIGIVGCGMIARFHVRALNDIPGTRVAALFDAIPASAAIPSAAGTNSLPG